MGNRYTMTTLTKRELETIESCAYKLSVIFRRRSPNYYNNGNEEGEPILLLLSILSDMDDLIELVKKLRGEKNENI